MATHRRTDPAPDAAREATAQRRRSGTAVEPPPPSEEEPIRPRAPGVVPEPELEEAPELLGDQSDYPAPIADDPERDQ